MTRIVLVTTLMMLFSGTISGQPWMKHVDNVGDKEDAVTFYEIRDAFNQYWNMKDKKPGQYRKTGIERKSPGWKQFKRWEHYWEYRINPSSGMFPSTTPYLELQKYKRTHPKAMASDPSSWRNLGVDTSYGGYAGIGRLNCIAFHPDDNDVIWVGAPSGGLWKTGDGGQTWNIQNEETAVLGVSDIVVAPDYSVSQTLYIATGDRDGGSLWSLGGGQSNDNNSIGVLKSTDGGATWQTSLSFDVSDKKLVTRILMHPTDDQTLYAATSDGVYKTTDGGGSWTLLSTRSFIDMEFKPGNPAIMYGSTQSYSYTRIYRSSDGGASWTEIQNKAGLRTELAVSQDDPERVYAVVADGEGGLEGIYRSTDAGQSFQLVFNTSNLLGYYSDGSETGGQGHYDLTIQADPNQADTLFVGGINTWRSFDGGNTWTCVNMWTTSTSYNFNDIPAVHADKHAMEFQNGTAVFFEGNDGGIYKSTDYGETWQDLTNGMVISQLYRLGTSQTDSSSVIAGLQDNGTKVMDAYKWNDVIGGDGFECIIDYENKNIQYGALYYGSLYRTTDLWNQRRSIKPADTVEGHWATPYVINPQNPSSLYAGYNFLWKTTDRGDSWERISNIKSDRKIRSLDVAGSDTLIVYMADPQHLYRSQDGGVSWIEVTNGLPVSSGAITSIQVSRESHDRLWVTIGNYNQYGVYESTDGGFNWENISTGLPDIPVMDVVQNTSNIQQTELYAATDIGVFRKIDNGDWEIFSSNLPNVVVTELDIYYDEDDPRNHLLRASTYGRGLWETKIPVLNFVEPPDLIFVQGQPESVELEWEANVSGDSVLLAGFEGSFSGEPEDGTTYQPGDLLPGGGQVLYCGKSQSSFTHTGLQTLTSYQYKLWSYDGNIYSSPVEKHIATTCYTPSSQAASLTFPSIGTNHVTLNWSRGSGENLLVMASERTIREDPLPGKGYEASDNYGEGDQLDQSSVYAVYNGTGDTVRVKGLKRDRNYYFNLYEYNIADSCYLMPALSESVTTLASGYGSLKENGFRIYPNPAKRHIVIEKPEDVEGFACEIFDYTGRMVYTESSISTGRKSITLSGMSSGLYVLVVKTPSLNLRQKIILK